MSKSTNAGVADSRCLALFRIHLRTLDGKPNKKADHHYEKIRIWNSTHP